MINAVATPYVSEAMLDGIADKMLQLPQAPVSITHSFGPGVYMRQMEAKAGGIIIGHPHTTCHTNMLVKGKCLFLNPDGTVITLEAPLTFVAMPGQKVAYVVEDMTWVNIHATTETNIDVLEAMYLDKKVLPEPPKIGYDGNDYALMLKDIGMSAELVRQISELDDVIPWPYGNYKVKVGKSNIEGQGIIAVGDIAEGEVIAVARMGAKRTPAGRFTNHSGTPNAKIVDDIDGNAYLMATKPIAGNLGGYSGEEVTVDYRQVLTDKLRLAA